MPGQAKKKTLHQNISRHKNKIQKKVRDLQSRRPHRSLRLTRRRDYKRALSLPGYWKFSLEVVKTLSQRKKLWLSLGVTYALLIVIFGGITNQETYRSIGDLLTGSADQVFETRVGQLTQAGVLSVVAFLGTSSTISEVQRFSIGLLGLLTWLTSVWLLREQLVGKKPKLRDGLYNAGAPLVATMIVVCILALQLLPLGILAFAYSALASVGLLAEGFGSFMAFLVAISVLTLSLYWMTSTFLALVIVTLPGMYPLQAMRAAGDLVVGRRLRILLRLIWLALLLAAAWLVIMIPTILIDSWLVGVWPPMAGIPLVPLVATATISASLIYAASYVYIAYRKIVANDA